MATRKTRADKAFVLKPSQVEPPLLYQCPGEDYRIERGVHLGRLAASYPACRSCVHRDDTGTLTAGQLDAFLGGPPQNRALHYGEGFAGVCHNELTSQVACRVATAMGGQIAAQAAGEQSGLDQRAVMVGGDGRAITAPLLAAATEGIRMAGCRAIDVGAVTTGCLTHALLHGKADGGILVGNPLGQSHTGGLKFWGASARPWSLPGSLTPLAELPGVAAGRPTRRLGPVERQSVETPYLATLRPYFHALRPLRFVVDTGCQTLLKWLMRLTDGTACQILPVSWPQGTGQVGVGHAGTGHAEKESSEGPAAGQRRERRRRQAIGQQELGRQVVERSAHFGIWVDGDGESCAVVDERGRLVPGEQLLLALVTVRLRGSLLEGSVGEGSAAKVVVEPDTSPAVVERLTAAGLQVVRGGSSRESLWQSLLAALEQSDAAVVGGVVGGGNSGRFCLTSRRGGFDALLVLSMLLAELSRSDCGLSVVLDAALLSD